MTSRGTAELAARNSQRGIFTSVNSKRILSLPIVSLTSLRVFEFSSRVDLFHSNLRGIFINIFPWIFFHWKNVHPKPGGFTNQASLA